MLAIRSVHNKDIYLDFFAIISKGTPFFFSFFFGLSIFPASAHRHLFSANNYNYVTHVRGSNADIKEHQRFNSCDLSAH